MKGMNLLLLVRCCHVSCAGPMVQNAREEQEQPPVPTIPRPRWRNLRSPEVCTVLLPYLLQHPFCLVQVNVLPACKAYDTKLKSPTIDNSESAGQATPMGSQVRSLLCASTGRCFIAPARNTNITLACGVDSHEPLESRIGSGFLLESWNL